jgi:hypothetical protein
MNKSHSIQVLLGVLMLCCTPALAQVNLNIVGSQVDADGVYVVAEASEVFVHVLGAPSDTVALMAAPIDKNGPDYSAVTLLMVGSYSISGAFQIPKGLAGMSFQIIAASLNADGDVTVSLATMTVVAS